MRFEFPIGGSNHRFEFIADVISNVNGLKAFPFFLVGLLLLLEVQVVEVEHEDQQHADDVHQEKLIVRNHVCG